MVNRFSLQDEKYLRENYTKLKYKDIAATLGRSRLSIKNKLAKMGLPLKFTIAPRKTAHASFGSYLSMMGRCYNPKLPEWKWYGGRGIAVCERWKESFWNFLADMGEKPKGYTIDRKDPEGNYEPANCQWIPNEEQAHTTRKYLAIKPCRICGKRRGNYGEGRCAKCSDYFRRAGKERPNVDDARKLRENYPSKRK